MKIHIAQKIRKLDNRQIRRIVDRIRKGSSYSQVAKDYHISKQRVMRLCKLKKVKSKHRFPNKTRLCSSCGQSY